LPEIKYRRILNNIFGPGSWALLPRGKHFYNPDKSYVTVPYGLYINGRFISQTWGEHEEQIRSISTALEGAKSNALMRCCKDLGIASELWDPNFIFEWINQYAIKVWVDDIKNQKGKKMLWRRKDRKKFSYPWKEV